MKRERPNSLLQRSDDGRELLRQSSGFTSSFYAHIHGNCLPMLIKRPYRQIAILAFAISTTSAVGKPVILSCETQFVGCVKELDGRNMCASPRLQKNTIELEEGSIRHLDDYGYFQYKKCELSETMIFCAEDPEPVSVPGSMQSVRRLTIERTTGRLDSSIDVELGTRNGVSPKQKGWVNKYTGYCTARENKTLF